MKDLEKENKGCQGGYSDGGEKGMKIAWEILAAAVLVAASILFVGRYQISAIGYQTDETNAPLNYALNCPNCFDDTHEEWEANSGLVITKHLSAR